MSHEICGLFFFLELGGELFADEYVPQQTDADFLTRCLEHFGHVFGQLIRDHRFLDFVHQEGVVLVHFQPLVEDGVQSGTDLDLLFAVGLGGLVVAKVEELSVPASDDQVVLFPVAV